MRLRETDYAFKTLASDTMCQYDRMFAGGVHRTPRIVPMTPSATPSLLHKVWEYPLFEALFGRRSRRFGLGLETTEGPFKYKSQCAPLALTESEEALLVAAGIGFSGTALWDQARPLPYRASDGRTFPQHIARPPDCVVLHQ